ncbi:MAG TPA: hypothetical protein VFJ58_29480 [Armatimonadota bacterium]|nr:hypothetical protein [Armatimonadota bacterium]
MPHELLDVVEDPAATSVEDPPATQPDGVMERRDRKKTAREEPLLLILCDLSQEMLDAWRTAFTGCGGVEIQQTRAIDTPTDAYVAFVAQPAADGGSPVPGRPDPPADQAAMEMRLTQAPGISVGAVKIGERFVIHLVAEPGDPLSGYGVTTFKITRAALTCITHLLAEHPGAIRSAAIPDLRLPGKQVDAQDAAHQMRRAIEEFLGRR